VLNDVEVIEAMREIVSLRTYLEIEGELSKTIAAARELAQRLELPLRQKIQSARDIREIVKNLEREYQIEGERWYRLKVRIEKLCKQPFNE